MAASPLHQLCAIASCSIGRFDMGAMVCPKKCVRLVSHLPVGRWAPGLYVTVHNTMPPDCTIPDFLITFVFYWWHRWRHESELLWVVFHQVHHSVARIESVASFYKSPLEILFDSMLMASVHYTLLGLTPAHMLYTSACSAYGEMFCTPKRGQRGCSLFTQTT